MMELQQWSKQIEIGIPKIDEQHKALITMLNDVHARVDKGIGDGSIEETLQGLQDYVAIHFGYEEQMLDQAGYVALEEHRELHRGFEKRLEDFSVQVEKGGANVDVEVIKFLTSWLIDHIQTVDAEYVATVKKSQSRSLEE